MDQALSCGDEEGTLQLKRLPEHRTGNVQKDIPSSVSETLRSPGQPLDTGTRSFMEPRLGYDFSKVRIHADSKAAESAQAIKSLAYTSGNHLVFNLGKYAPNSSEGKTLLGHELAHVVQNGSMPIPDTIRRWPRGVLEEQAIRRGRTLDRTQKKRTISPFNITLDRCDKSPYDEATVKQAAKDAYNKVKDSDCVKSETLKYDILDEFDGLEIDCEQSGSSCGGARRYFSQTVNIYPDSLKYNKCGPLKSTILHEIVHLTEWNPFGGEDRTSGCEKSCFGYGSGDASECK